MNIVYKQVQTLIPYAKNARTHGTEQVKQIAASIKEFGFTNPVLIDGENGIIAGHGRVMAAQLLGMDEVPCIELSYLTKPQKTAYIIADNKLALNAGWNDDMLRSCIEELKEMDYNISLTGFDKFEISELFSNTIPTDDEFDVDVEIESIKTAITKQGDIWCLGRHLLKCGDSTNSEDVAKLMNGAEADLVLTDPPYNVNYGDKAKMLGNYDKGHRNTNKILNDNMEDGAFLTFLIDSFTRMYEHSKKGAAIYVFHADSEGYNFRRAFGIAGYSMRQCLIWVKSSIVLGRQDYQWKHEPILYGWKPGAPHYFIDDRAQSTVWEETKTIDINRLKKDELLALANDLLQSRNHMQTTILREDKPNCNDLHPTMKPIKLLARLINNSSSIDGVVLDLFGGSGSTLIACEQTNRICYMMELDEKYCDVCIKRWEKLTGERAVKL